MRKKEKTYIQLKEKLTELNKQFKREENLVNKYDKLLSGNSPNKTAHEKAFNKHAKVIEEEQNRAYKDYYNAVHSKFKKADIERAMYETKSGVPNYSKMKAGFDTDKFLRNITGYKPKRQVKKWKHL